MKHHKYTPGNKYLPSLKKYVVKTQCGLAIANSPQIHTLTDAVTCKNCLRAIRKDLRNEIHVIYQEQLFLEKSVLELNRRIYRE